jgi:acetate kinase
MRHAAAINAGSSSLKIALCGEGLAEPIWKSVLEKGDSGWKQDPENFLKEKIADAAELCGIGHRFVHGGEKFVAPVLIDSPVIQELESLAPLAPLHNPANLLGVKWMKKLFPSLPQYAVFDTAFHHTLPPSRFVYPLPQAWRDQGIRRFGFHGISHASCFQKLQINHHGDARLDKVITCHLGGGCSLAALLNGQCLDTTMGFTPLEGLVMGTRSGSIDPGIIFYLLQQEISAQGVEQALWHESGLKGLAGSSDMRELHARAEEGDEQVHLALEIFCLKGAKEAAAMAVSLGGVSTIAFTGGIGENDWRVREKMGSQLKVLGVEIDPGKNRSLMGEGVISTATSKVLVVVVKTSEEVAIAQEVFTLL